MKLIRDEFPYSEYTYSPELIYPEPDKILFLDIETTGLSPNDSRVYLVGCAHLTENGCEIIQWMTENPDEEPELLKAFFEYAAGFNCLIHYNGSSFDLPFLAQRCFRYDLPCNFSVFQNVDIYRKITPYKTLLGLPDLKQKTIETFLGINRDDRYDGGKLIDVYLDYEQDHSESNEKLLLLHNYEDVQGMIKLLPMLSYHFLFDGKFHAKKAQANYYRDFHEKKRQELLITLALDAPLPKPISFAVSDCYLRAEKSEAVIKVPIYAEEMKYFYANYHDYYYLPEEDIALHKSVAGFVDKNYRVQAHASNCYTRKVSQYLPQWENLFTPFFKRNYEDREKFFELTDEFKKDRESFKKYAVHILNMIGKCCS